MRFDERLSWFDFEVIDSAAFKSGDIIGRPLLADPRSDKAHATVRKWLDRCTATHEQCRGTISGDTLDLFDEPWLPARVIDVGRADGSQVLRLLETQGRKGRYVALSYCWGPPDRHPLRTTKDNLEAHLECLKLESLIKTHQHAIAVTRAIGIKYLWID